MTSKINHSGDGETVSFSFPFFIPAKTALEVRVGGAIRAEGFNIVGAACPEGGKVVFDAPPASGEQVSLRYRGGVSVTVDDSTFGHLADKLVAGANVTLTTETQDGGVQKLRIDSGLNTFNQTVADGLYLSKAGNLSDVADKAAARNNLGISAVVATIETSLTNAVTALNASLASLSDRALLKTANLSDVADKEVARANLGVTTAIAAVQASLNALADSALLKAANLSDVADKDLARANLGVTAAIATAETSLNTAIAAVQASLDTLSDTALLKAANLSDVADKALARANLGVTDAIAAAETSLNNAIATLTASLGTLSAGAVLKVNNLSDVDAPLARHNLGLDNVAYLTVAQDWQKPQRSQAVQAVEAGGSVVLDFTQAQNFDLTLTADITFANPVLTGVVGQKGTIGIVPNGHAITNMGTLWKRVGETGSPSDITGYGRIDYHVRSTSRIEYAYNDVEA